MFEEIELYIESLVSSWASRNVYKRKREVRESFRNTELRMADSLVHLSQDLSLFHLRLKLASYPFASLYVISVLLLNNALEDSSRIKRETPLELSFMCQEFCVSVLCAIHHECLLI